MKTTNIFENIPKELKEELFEEILSKANLKIERIVSKGHITPDEQWYDQESDEWVIVLQGEAVLSFENADDVKLKCGDYLNIPAHTKHRVSWTLPESETIWLALHY
jgi:cupin 2 domain-containing protein